MLEPFVISVDEAILEDLGHRLRHHRPAPRIAGDPWSRGMDHDYLEELVEYWRTRFDWRTQEAAMNEYTHHRVHIDGFPIHFLHERGRGPRPVPLILSHGWPWTFWDFRHVIRPLTDPAAHGGDPLDAFDVVVPSLPGFGFSSPLPDGQHVSWLRTADLWVQLMRDVLGYERFAAHGGDFGARVTTQLGHKYADHLIGIHILGGGGNLAIWNIDRPWADLMRVELPTDPDARAAALAWERKFAPHMVMHCLEPQTLAAALHESPAGLAAWLVERRRAWSDCGGDVERRFSKDDLLTHVTLYWVTDTLASSVGFYAEAMRDRWHPSHDRSPVIGIPTGITVFRPDRAPTIHGDEPTPAMREQFDLCAFFIHDQGGHFAPAEEPATVVEDIRATFRPLREGTARG